MNGATSLTLNRPPQRSWLSRLKVPAIFVLIAVNMLVFGGNAVLDLWQTAGPGHPFRGTIAGHERVVTKGENSQEFLVLTVETPDGVLKLSVPQHTFDATSAGQMVTGEIDRSGLLGHDEGVRSLTADGSPVLSTSALRRAVGQLIVLAVIVAAGSLAIAWVWRGSRSRRALTPETPEVAG